MTVLPDAGRRFDVRFPPNWFEIDLWRATRTGELARMVDQRISETPAMASYRGAILTFLREVAADADRRGVVFAAAMAEPVDADRMLMATALAIVTQGPPDAAGNTVDEIAAQLTSTPASGHGSDATWRRVEVSEVAAGRCVRVTGVDLAQVAAGQSAPAVVMHTLIPVPGAQQVLDLVLTSPQPELADALLDLFDAISGTLTWAADETGPGDASGTGGPAH